MATIVQYNGVTLYNVTTRSWRHEMIYDDSGTDLIGDRLSMTFDGVIHAQRVSGFGVTDTKTYVASDSAPSSATAAYRTIEDLLKTPRQRLRVRFGNDIVIDVGPGDRPSSVNSGGILGTDIDNGPKPRFVELTNILGNSAFRVRFTIDVMVGNCKSITASNIVISNKWRVTEDMDSNFFTTRRIEGKLRLALSRPNGQAFPSGHQFRPVVMPVLEVGFRRESVSFTSTENGLECTYSVVDKQVHTSAPWPATDMEVVHEESTSDGVHYISGVQIRLRGAPNTDKRLLIERAVQIVEQRLDFTSRSPSEPEQIITKASIRDHIGKENSIEMDLQVVQVPKDVAFLTRLRKEKLGVPLELEGISITDTQGNTTTTTEIPGTEYDPRISAFPKIYGYDPHGGERRPSVLIVLHTFLQDRCMTNAERALYSGASSDSSEPTGESRGDTTVVEMPPGSLDDDPDEDRYNDESRAAVYMMSKISSRYDTHRMKVAMPISRRLGQNVQSATNVVFDLAEPQACRIFEIDIERAGKLPEVPFPAETITDGTLIQTLAKKEETILAPVLTADGRHEVFRVIARYEYILSRPPLPTEVLRIGSHPYTTGSTNGIAQASLYSTALA